VTVTAFAEEFRECLQDVLSVCPPEPDVDAMLFFRQWLAGRNLGLVPIADAPGFAWPGRWLARVRAADGDHAVVMFGSPSGSLFDPAGALARGGMIVEGWLVAHLDLQLPIDRPYGSGVTPGSVVGIFVAPEAEAPLVRLASAVALAGHGLEGDRYAVGRGTFSGPGLGLQLTLADADALDAVGLPWGEARRNLVTRGVDLNALVGRRFRVGAVECQGRRLAEPCAHLERLTRPGLLRPLVHRAGLRADIVVGGTIEDGDVVGAAD
jgi:hypothetical protein